MIVRFRKDTFQNENESKYAILYLQYNIVSGVWGGYGEAVPLPTPHTLSTPHSKILGALLSDNVHR